MSCEVVDLCNDSVPLQLWICTACTSENAPTYLVCGICFLERPSATAAPPSTSTQNVNIPLRRTSGLRAHEVQNQAVDETNIPWKCLLCTLENAGESLSCDACGALNLGEHAGVMDLAASQRVEDHESGVLNLQITPILSLTEETRPMASPGRNKTAGQLPCRSPVLTVNAQTTMNCTLSIVDVDFLVESFLVR